MIQQTRQNKTKGETKTKTKIKKQKKPKTNKKPSVADISVLPTLGRQGVEEQKIMQNFQGET